jgi:pyruvate/2-oxoglutarate dehydrogenase complex dihydrolipoamide dehydrogenase (E3) component
VPAPEFDLAIIGAGSAGLTAAAFAAQLGAKVALIEKSRPGGDCTWTGCVPSKALLKAAKVAHQVRTAARFGIVSPAPVADMPAVRDFIRRAIAEVYQPETPEALRTQGIDFVQGAARFTSPSTLVAGEREIRAKSFVIATGARPQIPPISGLERVPFLTYEQIFDNDHLPRTLTIIGGGPIGMELAQAYQRLGAQVTVIAARLLPKDEPEVRDTMQRVFEREGIRFVWAHAQSARTDGHEIVVSTPAGEARGDLLLLASGRRPNLADLDLGKAGVAHSATGIPVDRHLRTNISHIYAAGDILGGYQFTHLAGWQAFQAARNALLPGTTSGLTDLVPWVTFTDPEVAHIGLTEQQARTKHGDSVHASRWPMTRTDRAICEDDTDGFIKIVSTGGIPVGATVVHARAGETIAELTLAIQHRLKLSDLAAAIHPYPTYATAVQQLAAEQTVENLLSGFSGRLIRGLSGFTH